MLDYVVTFVYSDGNNSSYLYETLEEAQQEMHTVLSDLAAEAKEECPFPVDTEILYNKSNMEGALIVGKKPETKAIVSRIYE